MPALRKFLLFLCGKLANVNAASREVMRVTTFQSLLVLTILSFTDCCAEEQSSRQSLNATVACMLDVLKATQGIEKPKIGQSDRDGWRHPYLQYNFRERTGWTITVTFEAFRERTFDLKSGWSYTYSFTAMLPGLRGPGEEDLDWKTRVLSRAWRAKCNVIAVALSV
jgi:hypothetical protein